MNDDTKTQEQQDAELIAAYRIDRDIVIDHSQPNVDTLAYYSAAGRVVRYREDGMEDRLLRTIDRQAAEIRRLKIACGEALESGEWAAHQFDQTPSAAKRNVRRVINRLRIALRLDGQP